MADNSEEGKILFLAKKYVEPCDLLFDPTINIYLFMHFFRSSYNILAGLYISSTLHAFTLHSLAIVSHTLHFSNNSHNYINACMNQHASS